MLLFALLMALVGLVTATTDSLTDFILVTTSSSAEFSVIAALPDVSATSLFDPYMWHNSAYFLRLIGPGYGSLPCFNLTDGHLQTQAAGSHGLSSYEFYSHTVYEHLPFWFNTQMVPGARPLSLEKGYLLAAGGDVEGWTVCPGDLDQQVLVWQGNDTACAKRYVQAVKQAPY